MPKIAALGGLSSRGFGEFAQQTAANYIEDVFSTYLYTGTGATQTITNGIDLSGKGGLVWTKSRSNSTTNQLWCDTARGVLNFVRSQSTGAQVTYPNTLTAFNSNGFSLGSDIGLNNINEASQTYASWTFRKQPKFFDVVTYTGDGSGTLQVSHNLGSQPGFIILKQTSLANDWQVFARDSATTYKWLQLNATNSAGATPLQSNVASSTKINIGWIVSNLGGGLNANGQTYVAYLFAHNAGGFGADGSQNVISCGAVTPSSGSATVTLGWEPQYILFKNSAVADNWVVVDVMRGLSQTSQSFLYANTTDAEVATSGWITVTSTGFQFTGSALNSQYIYMAIRRGPMRTPTDATKVFSPVIWTGNDALNRVVGTLNSVDLMFNRTRTTTTQSWWVTPRLANGIMSFDLTLAEIDATPYLGFAVQSGVNLVSPTAGNVNALPYTSIGDMFCRAPGFMDVVCYTGTGAAITQAHNLGVVPELMIVKCRNGLDSWYVYSSSLPSASYYVRLNTTGAQATSSGLWNNTAPTSSVFSVGTGLSGSANTYVAYLFATCPGVSKVGSYTGTGATQTISCGFTGGARYVLIKRTDSTGDWWVWDTARGMVAGTDPRLPYNSTAAETNANWVYTTTGGFQIVTSDATVNASGGTYIYLAIA